MSKWLMALLICVITVFSSGPLFAQDENFEYSWGTVKSISPGQITVTEYDYDIDEDVTVTYSVAADIVLRGVKTLNDIVPGDSIDIEYAVQNGKKVMKDIIIEKPVKTEKQPAYAPSQTDEEEMESIEEETDETEDLDYDLE